MFDLARYINETHRERNRQQNGQQSITQCLIPSPTSSSEVSISSDFGVGILQPNLPNNVIPSSRRLNNPIQPDDTQDNVQQGNEAPENDDKINMTSALLTLVLYVCSISLVVYGAVHMKDCPAENMIAITYIAMGCLMLFSRILSCPEECRDIFNKERNSRFVPQTFCRMCINFIVQLAVICLFFSLCFWIFHIKPDTKEESPNYCAKDLYNYTYYGCIVSLCLFGLIFLATCCGICFVCCQQE